MKKALDNMDYLGVGPRLMSDANKNRILKRFEMIRNSKGSLDQLKKKLKAAEKRLLNINNH